MAETRRRPGREDKQLVAGHFPRDVAKQLRIIAATEDTTVQNLLAEAIAALLVNRRAPAEVIEQARESASQDVTLPLLEQLGFSPRTAAKAFAKSKVKAGAE